MLGIYADLCNTPQLAENILKRVKKYRESKERLEITGLTPEMKAAFVNLSGLDDKSYSGKLEALINHWNNSTITKSLPVMPEKKEAEPVTDWLKFDNDFINFLDNFKISNRTRPKLKTYGKQIREALEAKPDYNKAFKYICDKLPERILKFFRPMYLQGYFSLYEKDIIEISQAGTADKIILLLFESLKRMGKDEPVKEAKKILDLYSR
jgi:hypothetical protein